MILIGRDPACDVVLQAPGLSGVQALLLPSPDDHHRVVDFDSTNGTFVNGKRIADATVTPADELRFGATCLFNWATHGWSVAHPCDSRLLFTLGRNPANAIVVADARVSAAHAVVIDKGNTAFVVDVDSANGVFVNGTAVTSARVAPGDQVRLGSLEIDLQALVAEARAARAQTAGQAPSPNGTSRLTLSRARVLAFGLIGAAGIAAMVMLVLLSREGSSTRGWRSSLGSVGAAVGLRDPWDSAVERMSAHLHGSPDLASALDRDAATAARIAASLGVLDSLRPLLAQIDAWRKVRPDGDLGPATAAARQLLGTDIPDNAYDAVLAALELSSPGSGRTLEAVEGLARTGLEQRRALADLAAALGAASQEVRGFLAVPGRESLDRLASAARAALPRLDQTDSALASWDGQITQALERADAFRAGVQMAADTAPGALVRPQLAALNEMVGDIIAPVTDLAQSLGTLRASLGRERHALREVMKEVDGLK